MADIELIINGEPRVVPAPTTAAKLLEHLGLDARTVVVEHNSRIVRRASLTDAELAPGDRIELVHFVGGG